MGQGWGGAATAVGMDQGRSAITDPEQGPCRISSVPLTVLGNTRPPSGITGTRASRKGAPQASPGVPARCGGHRQRCSEPRAQRPASPGTAPPFPQEGAPQGSARPRRVPRAQAPDASPLGALLSTPQRRRRQESARNLAAFLGGAGRLVRPGQRQGAENLRSSQGPGRPGCSSSSEPPPQGSRRPRFSSSICEAALSHPRPVSQGQEPNIAPSYWRAERSAQVLFNSTHNCEAGTRCPSYKRRDRASEGTPPTAAPPSPGAVLRPPQGNWALEQGRPGPRSRPAPLP